MLNTEIKYLRNEDIDREKWDRCIENSINGIVYAWSWYLDRICDNWDAIIYGDYLYIMPLVWNKKFGIRYVFQPYFTQQLGIFSAYPTEKEIVNSFIHAIPKKFQLVEMNLNYQNTLVEGSIKNKTKITYHLSLENSIEKLRLEFSTNTNRNIKKAKKQNLHVSSIFNIDEFIEFTRKNLKEKSAEIKTTHYQKLKRVIGYAIYHHHGELIGVHNNHNQLIAASFFVWSNQKIIYLAGSSSEEGTEKKAMFSLIDHFIESRAGAKLTLDFEGSNLPGVARFYEGFGAHPISYSSIYRNTLPWYIQLFK